MISSYISAVKNTFLVMLVNKNKKYIIIMLCAVLVLTGLYFLIDFMPDSTDTASEANESIQLADIEIYDISKVNIKNEKGEFSVSVKTVTDSEGEKSAVCTVDGYNEAPIMETLPNTIAKDCTTLTAHRRVNKLGADDAEYGLDSPVSEVTVTLADAAEIKLKIGSEAPNTEARYVGFENDGTVYLVDSENLQSFMYGIYDIMDPTVIESGGDEFISLTVENNTCSEPVVIEISADARHSSVYNIISPIKRTANNDTVNTVAKNVRSFTADKVVAYNANASQIKEYGLDKPYASVTALYDDSTVKLMASKPHADGNVYLTVQGKNMVYQAKSDALPWIDASITDLKDSVILSPNFKELKTVMLQISDNTYRFDISFNEYTDDNGDLKTETAVTLGDKNVDSAQFKRLIKYASSAETTAQPTETSVSGAPTLKITYVYSNKELENDVLEIYSSGTGKAIAVLNGVIDSYAYDTYVSRIISDLAEF